MTWVEISAASRACTGKNWGRPEKTKFVNTKNGKPVAQMIPVEEVEDSLFGFYEGKLAVSGDIEAPSVAPEHWKRLK